MAFCFKGLMAIGPTSKGGCHWRHSERVLETAFYLPQLDLLASGTSLLASPLPAPPWLISTLTDVHRLDLTTASRVHLLEPQWSPMAEEQAIDRVHRMGQRREVVATRYIVKDSIEEVEKPSLVIPSRSLLFLLTSLYSMWCLYRETSLRLLRKR